MLLFALCIEPLSNSFEIVIWKFLFVFDLIGIIIIILRIAKTVQVLLRSFWGYLQPHNLFFKGSPPFRGERVLPLEFQTRLLCEQANQYFYLVEKRLNITNFSSGSRTPEEEIANLCNKKDLKLNKQCIEIE